MNSTSIPDESLRAGFLKQVALRPDAAALIVKDRVLSYGALDQKARRWAGAIVTRLGRPASRVGVFGSRSVISYSAAVAALYSGAAFVPLNPRFPPDRTRAMIRCADLDAIFVDQLGSAQLPSILQGMEKVPHVWLPETEGASELSSASSLDGELPPIQSEGMAYLMFTSGTSGTPKGVPISHSNVCAFISWAMHRYKFQSEDRFSQTFDQTFDLSVFDLFVAWNAGACVYAMSPVDLLAPTTFVNKNELTVWFSVPSVPAQMRKRNLLGPNTLPTLRWSLFCGEPLPRASAEQWQLAAPNSKVENLYGPTELTIACTAHRWNPTSSKSLCVNEMVPIGTPHPGLTAVLVDRELRLSPAGEPGELCISGAQTSPGYWKDQIKTEESFVKIQAAGLSGKIFYRTGDQARQLPNGEYVCLARNDFQIKILGFRVELGEIEGVLQRGSGVVQAVALGLPTSEGTVKSIVAFVSGTGIDLKVLHNACRAALADYMVPCRIIPVAEMPLTASGKIDRTALTKRLEEGTEFPAI